MNTSDSNPAHASIATAKLLEAFYETSALGSSVEDKVMTAELLQRHNLKKGAARATKALMKKQTRPFHQLFSAIGRFHNDETFEGFGRTRILPVGGLGTYEAKMRGFREEFDRILDKFVENYDVHLATEQATLGSRFEAKNYPTTGEDARSKFDFTFGVKALAAPDAIQAEWISGDVIASLQAREEARLAAAVSNVENEALTRGLELLADLAEELSKDTPVLVDSEKRKGVVPRLRDYLARLPERNLTGNHVLENLRQQIDEKLVLATDSLRESKWTRDDTARAARGILAQFKKLGARKVDFAPAAEAVAS